MEKTNASLSAAVAAFAAVAVAPLVALRGAFGDGLAATPDDVVGVASLATWSMVVLGSAYLAFALRADNAGEGGTMALLALLRRVAPGRRTRRHAVVILGLAAMACGIAAAVALPALALHAAADGIRIADGDLNHHVVATSLAGVALLLVLQRRARPRIEVVLAATLVAWVAMTAALGFIAIVRAPASLGALNPLAALRFVARHGWSATPALVHAGVVLGGLDLAYAARSALPAASLRRTWLVLAPLAVSGILGQAAALLEDPSDAGLPFYRLATASLLWPMIVLTFGAALYASRNALLGAALMLREAVRLGFLPRMRFARDDGTVGEHVHLPVLGVPLFLSLVVMLVFTHRPAALGAAYATPVVAGYLAVGAMLLLVARWQWRWPAAPVAAVAAAGVLLALPTLIGSAAELEHGAFAAPIVALVAFGLTTTWHRGRERLLQRTTSDTLPLDQFCDSIRAHPPRRVDQTGIVLTGRPEFVPQVLLNNLRFNHVLFERVLVLTVENDEDPHVASDARLAIEELGEGFFRARLRFGFAEDTHVPQALAAHAPEALRRAIATGVYLIGHEVVVAEGSTRLRGWRDKLFALMARNALPANAYFRIPSNRLIEIGTRWQA